MKKVFLLMMLIVISAVSFSQARTKSEILKSQASKWFKDNYVDPNFKDPYSYKLLNIKIDSCPNIRYYTNTVNSDSSNLSKLMNEKIPLISSMGEFYKKSSADYLKKSDDEKDKTMKEFYAKYAREYSDKLKLDSLEQLNKIEKNNSAIIKAKSDLKLSSASLASLKKSDMNKTYCYMFKLDCHSNNSYGNPVLGKYVFSYYPSTKSFDEPYKMND